MATLNSSITTQQAREDRAIYRAINLLENRLRKPGEAFNDAGNVRRYLALNLAGYDREVFSVLWLDAQHRLIEFEHLFFGTLTQANVYPREVVRRCLMLNAAAVILAHNHPSGSTEPSHADLILTHSLMEALGMFDVKVLDHFIIAGTSALSFAEKGLLGLVDFPSNEAQAEPPKKQRKK